MKDLKKNNEISFRTDIKMSGTLLNLEFEKQRSLRELKEEPMRLASAIHEKDL